MRKVAFLAFGERAGEGSMRFLHLEEVLAAFVAEGCRAEVAARRVVERTMPTVTAGASLGAWPTSTWLLCFTCVQGVLERMPVVLILVTG